MVYFGISLLTIACCFASFFTLKKLVSFCLFVYFRISSSHKSYHRIFSKTDNVQPFYRYYAKSCQKSVEDATEVEEEKGVTLMEFWQTFREVVIVAYEEKSER